MENIAKKPGRGEVIEKLPALISGALMVSKSGRQPDASDIVDIMASIMDKDIQRMESLDTLQLYSRVILPYVRGYTAKSNSGSGYTIVGELEEKAGYS